MILLNLNDQDCFAVLDARKDGILDAISAAGKWETSLEFLQVWPKLSERLKESLGTDIQVEEIQISCSPHLRSHRRGVEISLVWEASSAPSHQYTTRAPEWFDSWIRDEIGFVREDGEIIAFLR